MRCYAEGVKDRYDPLYSLWRRYPPHDCFDHRLPLVPMAPAGGGGGLATHGKVAFMGNQDSTKIPETSPTITADAPGSLAFPGVVAYDASQPRDVVVQIQKRLIAVGCGPLTPDGVFGLKTRAAVRVYQVRRGLQADGRVGVVTWASLFDGGTEGIKWHAPETPLLAAVLEVAKGYVGTREIGGPNRGPEVERWLALVGKPAGLPWCMAAVYGWFDEAATRVQVPNPLVRTAGVRDHWLRAITLARVAAHPVRQDVRRARPGMIFLIDSSGDPDDDDVRGHAGLVTGVTARGLLTIEGNTNVAGSREGDGVYTRVRRFSEPYGYLDYGVKPG